MRHQILRSSLTAIACLIPSITFAQIPQAQIDPTMFMVEKDIVTEKTQRKLNALSKYRNLREDTFYMLDINSDNYVSDREFSDYIDGFNISSTLPQSEQQKRHQKLEAIFNAADTGGQKKLTYQQFKTLWPEIENLIIDEVFSETDRNQNNYLDYGDLPTPEESQEQTQKQMRKLQEQLEKIGSDEWLDNFIKQNQQRRAEEDYYQMDKDHNNCVDKEEYTAYQIKQDNTLPPEERINFTQEDYSAIYDTIKRANPACVTQEEYLKDIAESANIGME